MSWEKQPNKWLDGALILVALVGVLGIYGMWLYLKIIHHR